MSRDAINLPTTHGVVRARLNANMFDIQRIESASKIIYCERGFVTPAGVTLDGSKAAPFENIGPAVLAAVPAGGVAAVLINPGDYNFAGGSLDIPANVSLIGQSGLGSVTFSTSIVIVDSISQIEGITISESYNLRVGDSDFGFVERFLVNNCIFRGHTNFLGGSTGNDIFTVLACSFGFIGDAGKVAKFYGASHVVSGCSFLPNVELEIGLQEDSAIPFTRTAFNDVVIASTLISINAADNIVTTVSFDSCNFISAPLIFNLGTAATINITMDLSSYETALNNGTDFIQPGVNLVVRGRSKYQYSDTVIPVDGLIAIAPNDPPLDVDYVDVCALSVDVVDGGIYTVTVNFIKFLADLTDGIYWRFTGDFPSDVFFVEAKDVEERIPFSYSFPIVASGTTFTFTLEAATEQGANSEAFISEANVTIERKY